MDLGHLGECSASVGKDEKALTEWNFLLSSVLFRFCPNDSEMNQAACCLAEYVFQEKSWSPVLPIASPLSK